MQATFTTETLTHVGQFLLMGFVAYVVLRIDNSSKAQKIERLEGERTITASINDMRRDMDEKHSENRQQIGTHIAEDDERFAGIKEDVKEIKQLLRSPRR